MRDGTAISSSAARAAAKYDRAAFVLQGGGALGSYQAGAYEVLAEAGIEPNWLSGVSIGAVNAAIIAGNRARQKDIIYSSRTRYNTDSFRRTRRLQVRLRDALQRVPRDALRPEEQALLRAPPGLVNILHLIYQQRSFEGEAKDYEFSRASMLHHWSCGYADTRHTLEHPEWLDPPPPADGVAVHDVHREATP